MHLYVLFILSVHLTGKAFDGSNNQGSNEVITDIKNIMRPWLRIDKLQPHSTNLAYTEHEVQRRSTFSPRYAAAAAAANQNSAKKSTQLVVPGKTKTTKTSTKTSTKATRSTTASVFDRLSNTSSFTGYHKHRFDPVTGKGKGRSGRSLAAKGYGHVPKSQRVRNNRWFYISTLNTFDHTVICADFIGIN